MNKRHSATPAVAGLLMVGFGQLNLSVMADAGRCRLAAHFFLLFTVFAYDEL